ncbi:hypothetical protein [Terriglobus albidus]|uniref:hypothetical protein n=1 Tax=Terriglobus albidus TaxID=1592106 RepID=UPI0021DFD717|nr:hypothetical protein [Terriglobus albidus]
MTDWVYAIQSPTGVVQTTVVARFREIVSLRILSSELVFNPSLQPGTIQAAIKVNDPERFLSQPWPPLDISTEQGIRIATLLKMKAIVAVRTGLSQATAAVIQAKVAHDFPAMDPALQDDTHRRVVSTVSMLETGTILYGFTYPQSGSLPLDGNSVEDTISYVKLMTILGLEQALEAPSGAEAPRLCI